MCFNVVLMGSDFCKKDDIHSEPNVHMDMKLFGNLRCSKKFGCEMIFLLQI